MTRVITVSFPRTPCDTSKVPLALGPMAKGLLISRVRNLRGSDAAAYAIRGVKLPMGEQARYTFLCRHVHV